jgi:hypothetical protein
MALRADVYQIFDDRRFVIVRKKSSWTIHFLTQTNDLGRVYHNTVIDLSDSISPEFILARFAWSIFPLLRGFLDAGFPRQIRIQVMTDDGISEQIVKKSDELRSLSSESRSVGGASKKQKIESDNNPRGTTHYHASLSASSSAEKMSSNLTNPTEFSEKRSCEYCLLPYCIDVEKCRVAALVAKELKKQRPTEPQLICCNYNTVDRDIASGKPGRQKYDGAYLCPDCLGTETRNQFPKVNDWESQTLTEELWGKY